MLKFKVSALALLSTLSATLSACGGGGESNTNVVCDQNGKCVERTTDITGSPSTPAVISSNQTNPGTPGLQSEPKQSIKQQ